MTITPEDLITKSFKIVTEESGYDRNEVDDFLDELVVELRALYSERDALERQVEQLSVSAPASPAAAVSQEAPSAAGFRVAFSTALWPEVRDRLLWSRVRVLEGGVTGSVGTSVMGV